MHLANLVEMVESGFDDRVLLESGHGPVTGADLGRLVSATYPLRRFEDAIAHAASAGSRGAVKIAFDLRSERERDSI